ncbi:unnamed protein product [Diatraea saccharalis]|uniref:Uncharacterized protein n=1 Tax=Diatraea saccharalis TaxID=40085 RepID=A0A9N9R2B6_9NEOP|nr:unnamed protein product [Diatraea saccharalis]
MDSGSVEPAPNGAVHLDTVRALHQTVVSLRTALEVSKNELRELKEKYEQHSQCNEFADVIEKLTLENHILRKKITDSGQEDKDTDTQSIKLAVTYSPRTQTNEDYTSEVIIQTATTDVNTTVETSDPVCVSDTVEGVLFCSSDKLNKAFQAQQQSSDSESSTDLKSPIEPEEEEVQNSQVSNFHEESEDTQQPTYKTKLELLSKFDVRIKVRTLKEGSVPSSTTSDSDSTAEDKKSEDSTKYPKTTFQFEEKKEHFENAEDPKGNKVNIKAATIENIKMAVPNEAESKSKVDKLDVQVRITSEENLIVKEHFERSRRKDTLNLDVDDLSLRSMSEGDNSVFSEGVVTPMDPTAGAGVDEKLEQENASGNESEEEDLVSIRESDQWGPSSVSTHSTHSTPVLIKFHTLDPDFQPGGETKDNAENENEENSSIQGIIAESCLRTKRVSLPSDKEIRHVAFNSKGSLDLPGRGILKSYENKSDNTLYKKSPNTSTRRLDSVDSLTCEYNRGLSFDNTKSSSFELGSSMDILHREESVDSFQKPHHLGHRFSVFAETDISKCGISEDDLAMNLNMRRNTCPNPFQYRPTGYRSSARPVGPLKAGAGGLSSRHIRPVLREGSAPRRSSAAQTDVCALPNRWSSDGYLAHKMWPPPSLPPPLPRRVSAAGASSVSSRRLTVPHARLPPAASDESRPVPLSDIGYPESRPWRSSLPDVRYDDTDELVHEAEVFLRRSIDNLRYTSLDRE